MQTFVNKIDDVIPKLLKLDRDTLFDIKITKHKEKRSLDANAYYWVLNGKISEALNQDKQKIHLMMLKSYGVVYQMASPSKEISGIKYFELDGILARIILNRYYSYFLLLFLFFSCIYWFYSYVCHILPPILIQMLFSLHYLI